MPRHHLSHGQCNDLMKQRQPDFSTGSVENIQELGIHLVGRWTSLVDDTPGCGKGRKNLGTTSRYKYVLIFY